jgi:hypothetical protein
MEFSKADSLDDLDGMVRQPGEAVVDRVLRVGVHRLGPATVDHGDELGNMTDDQKATSMLRFGLRRIFRDQPIKFLNTTATALGRTGSLPGRQMEVHVEDKVAAQVTFKVAKKPKTIDLTQASHGSRSSPGVVN